MIKPGRYITFNVVVSILLILWGFVLLLAGSAHAADKPKSAVTRYWMSISTEKSIIPGMPDGMPDMGGLFGRGDSGKKLLLQLYSPKAPPAGPVASHDIPPAQNMGDSLPLIIPERERRQETEEAGKPSGMEKPKMRMLIYWGCGETIRKGQPRVLDTEKMSLAEFGKAMGGRVAARHIPPSPDSSRGYAEWPNEKDRTPVPKNSSLVGAHLVHGNYLPDMRFAIGSGHDFMAPVAFTSVKGSPADSFRFQWRPIPTATGYFATAMGHEEKTGTMIIWSSSEIAEPGYTLMDYLPQEEVRRMIREKVVMPPSVNQCAIPRGVFKDAEGGILQFIAYGDELNIVYPPRDPKKPVDPIWTVKARRKSTGMLPLMAMDDNGDEKNRGRERDSADEESPEGNGGISPGKALRGILGF